MYYSRVAIYCILYLFFRFFAPFALIFRISISFWFLVFSFSVLYFEFSVISKDVITFVLSESIVNHVLSNIVLPLYKRSGKKCMNCVLKTCIQRGFKFIKKNVFIKKSVAYTLRVLIFAGTNFRDFREFWSISRN